MRRTPPTGGSTRLRQLAGAAGRARRRFLPLRRGIAAGLLLGLAATAGVVAASGFGTATAGSTVPPGRPVPASQVQTIAAAALSCPMLTPTRLAGQLMAASGFDPAARVEGGGEGIAGLTPAVWDVWKPGTTARRADPTANIFALAHHMCDLSGQVRGSGVAGDEWRLALAAYRHGLPAVREAGGIPGRAEDYVDTGAHNTAWYAPQPECPRSTPTPTPGPGGGVPPGTGTPAVPVPVEHQQAIRAAGKVCPAMTPARVAGQLMAASAFNPNLLGANGAQGIAQFDPAVWAEYAPRAAATSPWDPHQAIAALGVVMCRLITEVGEVGKGDAYPKALAAFQWGPAAVQRAGGVPDTPAVRDFVSLTQRYTGTYERQPPFGVTPPVTAERTSSPSGTPSAPSTGATPSRTAGDVPPTQATTPPTSPRPPASTPKPKPVGAAGPIIGYGSGSCIDVTDGAYQSNPPLQIWSCNGGPNQRWTFHSDGTVRSFDRCMTVAGGSTANGAKILLSPCSGSASQRFTLNKAHDLVNVRADKCVDAVDLQTGDGTRLQLWECAGTANQKWHR